MNDDCLSDVSDHSSNTGRNDHILAVVNETFHMEDEEDDDDYFDYSFDDEDDDTDEEVEIFRFPSGPVRLVECEVCLLEGLLKLRICCEGPVCDDCMVKYLEDKAAMAMVQIQCPNPRCQKYVGREEILGRLTGTLREQFRQHLIDANRDPYMKTCPGCNHITKMTRQGLKLSSKVDCVKCEQAWCFKCHTIWHNGITCSKYQQGAKLLKRWAKSDGTGQVNAQKCPKCKFYIERISGCDVMTCSRCYTEFCYSCGGRFHSLGLFGNHHSRFSIVGCRNRLLARHPGPRRLVRGSIFGLALLAAPVVGTVGFVAGLVALPVYGSYKLYKKIRRRRRAKRRSQDDSFDISDLLDIEFPYDPTGDEDTDADLLLRTLINAHLGTTVRDSLRLRRPQNQRKDSYLLRANSATEANSVSSCAGDHLLRKAHSCSCLVALTGEIIGDVTGESDVESEMGSTNTSDDDKSDFVDDESAIETGTDVPRPNIRRKRSSSFDSSWNQSSRPKNQELRKLLKDTIPRCNADYYARRLDKIRRYLRQYNHQSEATMSPNDLALTENKVTEKHPDEEPDILITRL